MVKKAQNPVMGMIFNDLSPVYLLLCERYFSMDRARNQSRGYYKTLTAAIRDGDMDIRELIEASMQDAKGLWEEML